MGSFTSLMAVANMPDNVHSLTLIGCSTGARNAGEQNQCRCDLEREIALLDHSGGQGAFDWFANDSAYARMQEKQPDVWNSYLKRLRGQSVQGARSILKSVHWNRESLLKMSEDIQRIKAPVLVLLGEKDHPLVLQTAPFLQECLTHSSVIAVPKTGHLVHLEEPELFQKAVSEMINPSSSTYTKDDAK